MLLSRDDISHISSHGYDQNDFCFQNEDGFIQLKNVKGECFFLEDNKCGIYDIRPAGCQFYPIIFDLDENKAILDDECPLIDSITEKTIKRFEDDLRKFVLQILKEK